MLDKTGGRVNDNGYGNAPVMTFGGDSDFPIMPVQSRSSDDDNFNFERLDDKFDFKAPKFDLPKIAESSSSTTSNSTNTFNFGNVNINNGSDFDEFVFKLQQLLAGSTANSAMA